MDAQPTYAELRATFAEFDALPIGNESHAPSIGKETWDPRKNMARTLQSGVQDQKIILTEAQFRECRDGDAPLGRILAYLFAEYEKIKTELADRRTYIVAEWERLQRSSFARGTSTMPLYYAVRCYLTYLKSSPDSAVGAQADEELLKQIDRTLSENGMDRGGQVRRALAEITSLIAKSKDSQSSPAVVAAHVTRKGTIVAAVIAAFIALLVGLLANWDKIAKIVGSNQNSQESSPASSHEKP